MYTHVSKSIQSVWKLLFKLRSCWKYLPMLLNTLFLLALLYRWMIIYLADFHVIGHLFSSKILNVSSNSMIDDFEHKFHKWFLIQDYFICMENLASDLSLPPHFSTLFFFYVLRLLWAFIFHFKNFSARWWNVLSTQVIYEVPFSSML